MTNCRSGYKATREEEEAIQSGKVSPNKKNLFAFPTEPNLRAQWVDAVEARDELNLCHSAVCELHFVPDDFENDPSPRTGKERQRRRLKSGAVPTLYP